MFDIGGGQKDKTKLARDKENFIQNFCLSSPASLIPPNSIVSFSLMGKGFCFLPPICIFSQMGIFFSFSPNTKPGILFSPEGDKNQEILHHFWLRRR